MTRPKDIDGIEIPRIPSPPPPTEEEHRRMVEVLEELRIWREKLLAERGGELYPNAWEEFDMYEGMDGMGPEQPDEQP